MSATELMLIDLSGIAHMEWHADTTNPDPSHVSTKTIARVRALAAAHPHAAICCDSGRSFRADIDQTYKANRDTENRAPLKHQMMLACETLKRDGFVVWSVPGFEADDLIATATKLATVIDDTSVLIVSADKDLLQLVTDRVRVKSLVTGNVSGPAEVFDKFGVKPSQMGDLLALMGDKSDNIKGAERIGNVIGARLLSEHGTLSALFDKMAQGLVNGVTATMRTNLLEFKERWPTVAKLIALRTDVPIEFSEIAAERTAPPMEAEMAEPFKQGDDANDEPLPQEFQNDSLAALSGAAQAPPYDAAKDRAQQEHIARTVSVPALTAGVLRSQAAMMPYAGPVDFSQQLEPRSMDDAVKLAQRMYESRLFGAYGTPQAVLATVLAGRELGLPAMASLRAFHIIEGKPTLSAGIIQSLVMKSKLAKYFRCTERTAEKATFATQRGDEPEVTLTYTVAEGRAAWPKDDAAFAKSGWGRNPADMCVARASSKLARLVYPDVVSGLYAPEEMSDGN